MSGAVEAARLRAREHFDALVQGHEEPPLDLACAWISVEERPVLDAHKVVAKLDDIAAGLRLPPNISVIEQVARLNHHLFEEHGFRGDTQHYQEPRNALIDQVIQRRMGLPILVSVVMLEVARRVGIEMDGIGFPGHFLVSPRAADPRFFIDPFNEGRVLRVDQLAARVVTMAGGREVPQATLEAVLAPVPDRYILVRINNNLKGAWLRQGDVAAALRAVERLLVLSPDVLDEVRDRGLMLAHLGRTDEAIPVLRDYLDRWPDAPDQERIRSKLDELESA